MRLMSVDRFMLTSSCAKSSWDRRRGFSCEWLWPMVGRCSRSTAQHVGKSPSQFRESQVIDVNLQLFKVRMDGMNTYLGKQGSLAIKKHRAAMGRACQVAFIPTDRPSKQTVSIQWPDSVDTRTSSNSRLEAEGTLHRAATGATARRHSNPHSKPHYRTEYYTGTTIPRVGGT